MAVYTSVTGDKRTACSSRDLNRIFNNRCFYDDYRDKKLIGEGTYGEVYYATDLKNNRLVALKRLRFKDNLRFDGLPITTLRELALLRSLRHPNIVQLLDVACGDEIDDLCLVMESCLMDLADVIDNRRTIIPLDDCKSLIRQLLLGVAYLHSNNIVHRDLKLSNLLITSKGILKIADFGMAREIFDQDASLTPNVVTIWYRSPELLMESKYYSFSCDLWSVGCVMAELLLNRPLLPGSNESEQMALIVELLGTPNEKNWPGFSTLPGSSLIHNCSARKPENNLESKFKDLAMDTFSLIEAFLRYNPDLRITAREALDHQYFYNSPLPSSPSSYAFLDKQSLKRKSSN